MTSIFGLAGMSASDFQFVNQIGQTMLYEMTQTYLTYINNDVQRAVSVFVQDVTEDHNQRYRLPGSGRMSERAEGTNGAAVRTVGSVSVGFPLHDFSEQVAGTREDLAYMTPADYQSHIDTIVNRYRTELRWRILNALFDSTTTTFSDKRWGDLTIKPLANGDSDTYPPVAGSTSEATDTHYLESNYAATAISDTNNPFVTIYDELIEHFEGGMQGGDNIVVFINQAERPETEDLTDFDPVEDRFVRSGDNRDVPVNLPNVPGRIIGRTNGCWVSEWRWIPASYMLGIHLEAPAPCKMRVDPAATGLPRGLTLVAEDDRYPISSAEWNARFGIAVANRLNGVALELGTGGSYTDPTAYSD